MRVGNSPASAVLNRCFAASTCTKCKGSPSIPMPSHRLSRSLRRCVLVQSQLAFGPCASQNPRRQVCLRTPAVVLFGLSILIAPTFFFGFSGRGFRTRAHVLTKDSGGPLWKPPTSRGDGHPVDPASILARTETGPKGLHGLQHWKMRWVALVLNTAPLDLAYVAYMAVVVKTVFEFTTPF